MAVVVLSIDLGKNLCSLVGFDGAGQVVGRIGRRQQPLGISKRENAYLRRLFIHCARATLPHLAVIDTAIGRWLKALMERSHRNFVVVALANKLARIAWAVLAHGRRYSTSYAARIAEEAEVSAGG